MNWFQKLFGKVKDVTETVVYVPPFSINLASFRFNEKRNCPQVFLYRSVSFRNLDTNGIVSLNDIWVDIQDESPSYDSYFALIHPESPNLKSYEVGNSYNYETRKVFENLNRQCVRAKSGT